MIVWMLVAPATLLLLAFGAGNWRVFHLGYCKRLMRDTDHRRRREGLRLLVGTHLQEGMTSEQILALGLPLEVQPFLDGDKVNSGDSYIKIADSEKSANWGLKVQFDEHRKLLEVRAFWGYVFPALRGTRKRLSTGHTYDLKPDGDGRFLLAEDWLRACPDP